MIKYIYILLLISFMLLFFDLEVTTSKINRIKDIGAVDQNGEEIFHDDNISSFNNILNKYDFLVGHNIINHDLKELSKEKKINYSIFDKDIIDTLYLSSLFFINKPYHKLIKDYKLDSGSKNNPVNDSILCKEIFDDTVNEFLSLGSNIQNIFYNILKDNYLFRGFFKYLESYKGLNFKDIDFNKLIKLELKSKVCDYLDFNDLKKENDLFLAYIFSILFRKLKPNHLLFPVWVRKNFEGLNDFFKKIRRSNCNICDYCKKINDLDYHFNRFFNKKWKPEYDNQINWKEKIGEEAWQFRSYLGIHGMVSQKEVIIQTQKGKNVLVVFPTGGGKSITFQLPALLDAEKYGNLVLIISPLVSLMKDQVEGLEKNGIENSGYLNGLLTPIERKNTIDRIEDGRINLLYLAPETLRSESIKKLLQTRNIQRIVIDEAHCFSKWGHDFRTDYMFIGPFINELYDNEYNLQNINISCFTATAKDDVINDIKKYFKKNLNKDFIEYIGEVKRPNLKYEVENINDEKGRFEKLVDILKNKVGEDDIVIIFVRTTKQAQNLSEKLNGSEFNFNTGYYHGKMDKDDKNTIQESFINGSINIIIATNAFGMGVDKTNVRYVIHYEISSSIENYVQEAGRAGRDGENSTCIILYNKNDLDKNFRLIKQSELDKKEITNILRAIRSQKFKSFSIGAKELLKKANINTETGNYETVLKTALFILETQGFIKRGFNRTRIFATSKGLNNLTDGYNIINSIDNLNDKDKGLSKKILKNIFSGDKITMEDLAYTICNSFEQNIELKNLILHAENLVSIMRENKILEKKDDINLLLNIHGGIKKSLNYFGIYQKIIDLFIIKLDENYRGIGEENYIEFNVKNFNKYVSDILGRKTLQKEILNLIYFLQNRKYIRFKNNNLLFFVEFKTIKISLNLLTLSSENVIKDLLHSSVSIKQENNESISIETSIEKIKDILVKGKIYNNINVSHIERILYFLHKLEVIKVNSGIFVFQTYYKIEKKEKINDRFTDSNYEILKLHYTEKIKQVHILGEYIEKLSIGFGGDKFVEDYFELSILNFIEKYFNRRKGIIERPVTENKYEQIIKELSTNQREIVEEKNNNIIVIAGPGSGKTKVLIHKVASLVLLEGVKLNQFLMLTFSRSAKYEIKERLLDILGKEAYALSIETFHSYSFKRLGLEGDIKDTNIINKATDNINDDEEILPYKVILIDEYQDIDKDQYNLIKAIKDKSNANIIAVGDDDQNIYEFRNSDIGYIRKFKEEFGAKKVELSTNYRGSKELVEFTNKFIKKASDRIKSKELISNEKRNLFSFSSEKNIFTYTCGDIDIIIDEVLLKYKGKDDIGIITFSNEKVLKIKNILDDKGEESEIILSKLPFKLSHTLELNLLFKELYSKKKKNFSDNEINEIYDEIINNYGENNNTRKISLFLDNYLKNKKKVFLLSLEEYFREAELDDILENKRIKISTFHKAKGKEFNNVVIILDNSLGSKITDEKRRLIYVGMTRAKKSLLFFGENSNIIFKELLSYKKSENINLGYGKIKKDEKLSVILGLDGVNLGWNKNKNIIKFTNIGKDVTLNDEGWGILSDNKLVQGLSNKGVKEIQRYKNKGYSIEKINIFNRLIYKLQDGEEALVYLITINFIKFS